MEQRHHSSHAHAPPPQHHETTTTTTHAIRTQRPLPSLPASPLGDGADITERPSPADPEEGPNRLRSMLLTAFGLDENGDVLGDDGTEAALAVAITDAPEATTSPPPVDPSADPLGALADQLFRTLLDPANAPSDWNWLDPASDSFARVATDSQEQEQQQQRTATVRAVYHHLLSERERKATALIAEILRNEVTYNLTMTCFNTGIERVRTRAGNFPPAREILTFFLSLTCSTL
ncbi:hypothetical protein PINS_up010791 [Pythium insidiosum]|nr:hypothetical protein PINS_up010791 [Pythium insidiosum]